MNRMCKFRAEIIAFMTVNSKLTRQSRKEILKFLMLAEFMRRPQT